MDTAVELLPPEGYLTENETGDGGKEIEEQVSDFLVRVGGEAYLLESQSYDDGSMAIRVAEYAFITARQSAVWDMGHATVPMPNFAVVYVKGTGRTPKRTTVTFVFPDGQSVDYASDNVILEGFTKEQIVGKRLFPYIPFYIVRYEKGILSGEGVEEAVRDLAYFRDALVHLYQAGELSDGELVDLKGFVNTIITHITDGGQDEERLVNVMGGIVIETESERLVRYGISEGRIQTIIELGQEDGLGDEVILERLQKKTRLSLGMENMATHGPCLAT